MLDMRILQDFHEFGNLYRAAFRDHPYIVSPEVNKHYMFSPFFFIMQHM